ncbi:TRAP transporter substrate-binding protein [Oceanimonas sp. MB9]|uniref:TRAP transporter substrate-binding protein n=1 Tax=Oceanimonas sp. MB9 TaxID=2588453 RepID=UPI0013F67CC7|nr:TRAP transporter substrate-binding protein [Oceanimonas sp. MB9]NHI01656.1 Solute-binding protein [Oceanimonas sp. MB9]
MQKTLSALALSLALLLPQHTTAATRMDFSNEYNHSSIHAEGDGYFIDKVKELTSNEVTIALHTGGALGYKSADHFYAVADNAIQLADTLAGTLAGVDPIFALSSLPFLVRNEDDAERLYRLARPHYDKVFADNDQILLYASPWPASGIWAKQEVASTAGLNNLKIRTYDKNGTLTLKNAGASPVNLSWADVVPQLSTGGISAVLTSAEAGANASFWEHLEHYSAIQYAIPLNMVHMNRSEFERLSPEQQTAVLEAARQTDERNWQQVRARVAENYRTLQQHGVAIKEQLPTEFMQELQAAAHTTTERWLEETGERGRQILEQFRQGS